MPPTSALILSASHPVAGTECQQKAHGLVRAEMALHDGHECFVQVRAQGQGVVAHPAAHLDGEVDQRAQPVGSRQRARGDAALERQHHRRGVQRRSRDEEQRPENDRGARRSAGGDSQGDVLDGGIGNLRQERKIEGRKVRDRTAHGDLVGGGAGGGNAREDRHHLVGRDVGQAEEHIHRLGSAEMIVRQAGDRGSRHTPVGGGIVGRELRQHGDGVGSREPVGGAVQNHVHELRRRQPKRRADFGDLPGCQDTIALRVGHQGPTQQSDCRVRRGSEFLDERGDGSADVLPDAGIVEPCVDRQREHRLPQAQSLGLGDRAAVMHRIRQRRDHRLDVGAVTVSTGRQMERGHDLAQHCHGNGAAAEVDHAGQNHRALFQREARHEERVMYVGHRRRPCSNGMRQHLTDCDLPLDAAVDRDVDEDGQALRRREPLGPDQLADILNDFIGETARHIGEQCRVSALPHERLRAGSRLDRSQQRHDGVGLLSELVNERGDTALVALDQSDERGTGLDDDGSAVASLDRRLHVAQRQLDQHVDGGFLRNRRSGFESPQPEWRRWRRWPTAPLCASR